MSSHNLSLPDPHRGDSPNQPSNSADSVHRPTSRSPLSTSSDDIPHYRTNRPQYGVLPKYPPRVLGDRPQLSRFSNPTRPLVRARNRKLVEVPDRIGSDNGTPLPTINISSPSKSYVALRPLKTPSPLPSRTSTLIRPHPLSGEKSPSIRKKRSLNLNYQFGEETKDDGLNEDEDDVRMRSPSLSHSPTYQSPQARSTTHLPVYTGKAKVQNPTSKLESEAIAGYKREIQRLNQSLLSSEKVRQDLEERNLSLEDEVRKWREQAEVAELDLQKARETFSASSAKLEREHSRLVFERSKLQQENQNLHGVNVKYQRYVESQRKLLNEEFPLSKSQVSSAAHNQTPSYFSSTSSNAIASSSKVRLPPIQPASQDPGRIPSYARPTIASSSRTVGNKDTNKPLTIESPPPTGRTVRHVSRPIPPTLLPQQSRSFHLFPLPEEQIQQTEDQYEPSNAGNTAPDLLNTSRVSISNSSPRLRGAALEPIPDRAQSPTDGQPQPLAQDSKPAPQASPPFVIPLPIISPGGPWPPADLVVKFQQVFGRRFKQDVLEIHAIDYINNTPHGEEVIAALSPHLASPITLETIEIMFSKEIRSISEQPTEQFQIYECQSVFGLFIIFEGLNMGISGDVLRPIYTAIDTKIKSYCSKWLSINSSRETKDRALRKYIKANCLYVQK